MEHEIWCRKLRAYRRERGYTQKQVAEALNLSRSQYTCLESGRNVINYRHMYNLAKFFQVNMATLMTFKPKTVETV